MMRRLWGENQRKSTTSRGIVKLFAAGIIQVFGSFWRKWIKLTELSQVLSLPHQKHFVLPDLQLRVLNRDNNETRCVYSVLTSWVCLQSPFTLLVLFRGWSVKPSLRATATCSSSTGSFKYMCFPPCLLIRQMESRWIKSSAALNI